MKNVKIETHAKQATSLADMKGQNGQRRMGMVYYQLLTSDRFVARVISKETNVEWLEKAIEQGIIFVPCALILSEAG